MKIKHSLLFLFPLFFVLVSAFGTAEAAPSSHPHYIVVVDNSGSMKKTLASESALDFLDAFMEHLEPGDKTTIISFGSTPREIVKSEDITINIVERELFSFEESYTDIQSGFLFTLNLLKQKKKVSEQIFVVFLSDGVLDLVSRKSATFPSSLLEKGDYADLLSRYAPYIEGNTIQRDQIDSFNEEINQIGAKAFYQNVIPELKKEIAPLFFLTFSDGSPLLRQLSQQISLKGEMQNYSLLKNPENHSTFLDEFFRYVKGIMALRKEKSIQQENDRIKAEALLAHEKQKAVQAVIPEPSPVPEKSSQLTQEEVFKIPNQREEVVVAPEVKEYSPKEVPQNEGTSIFVILSFIVLFCTVLLLLFLRKKKHGIEEKSEFAIANEKPKEMNNEGKDELPANPLRIDDDGVVQRLRKLEEFQTKSLAESDNYLGTAIKGIGDEKGFNYAANLNIKEGRINFRQKVPSRCGVTFLFTMKDFHLEGRLHDISEGGLGLTVSRMPKSTGIKSSMKGRIVLHHDDRSIMLAPAKIAHIEENNGIMGISLKGLKEDPDMRLIWLETFSQIINDIKEEKNE